MSTAERIRLPDDCTIGYIVEALLGVPLVRCGLFHSHLENLQQVPASELHEQVRVQGMHVQAMRAPGGERLGEEGGRKWGGGGGGGCGRGGATALNRSPRPGCWLPPPRHPDLPSSSPMVRLSCLCLRQDTYSEPFGSSLCP